jgi:hypothetical protein
MVLLWRKLHRDFLRFANWTRPPGLCGKFYQVVQGQHQLLCALSTAESLSCPKGIGSIGFTTVFQGRQYSSCSKAGGCRAAQLLGGFRRNLLIISWVTQTPAAYFAPIRQIWSRATCRVSGRNTFHHFWRLYLKKAVDRGQYLGIYGNPWSKQQVHSNSTGTKIIWTLHSKNPTFYVFTPCLFWDWIWIRFQIQKLTKFIYM